MSNDRVRGVREGPATGENDGAPDLISQVYDQLHELIVTGRLAPGARIVESVVAEKLEVSRTPVRSALQRLQQEGYVVGSDGARRTQLTVAPLTKEDGHELFCLVGELEGYAAELAARLPREERDELVDTLRSINEELRNASDQRRPDARHIFDLHTEFHQKYVDAAAGPRLLALPGGAQGGHGGDHAARPPRDERDGLGDALRSISEELRNASHQRRPGARHIFDLHSELHQKYVDAAAGPRLLALHSVMKPQAERYRRLYSTALGGEIEPSLREHDEIIEHITKGDPTAAAEAARQNWRHAAERLVQESEGV